MPSYIEIEKNASLPQPSSEGRVILGANVSGSLVTTDITSNITTIIGGVTTVTLSEIQDLVSNSSLQPGAYYLISGVDSNHGLNYNYDIEVIVQAINSNTLGSRGFGKFYNPKYDSSVLGFNIFDRKMKLSLTNLSGSFQYGEWIQNNNGDTGYYVHTRQIAYDGGAQYWYANNLDQWVGATSITGSDSGATAEIQSIIVPSYASGSKVIWGGRMWGNLNGDVGAPNNYTELDASWELIPYNDTDYNIVWDQIEYDFDNDFITLRKDKAGNTVIQSYAEYNWMEDRSIGYFPWGNEFIYDNDYKGFAGNIIKASTVQLLNFRGQYFLNNAFDNYCYWSYDMEFEEYAQIERNTFSNAYFYYSFISGDGFNIKYNTINNGGFNYIFGSGYGNIDNNVSYDSDISNNSFIKSYLRHNVLHAGSYIGGNYLRNSYIDYNQLHTSTIGDSNNYLINYSNISNNILNSYGYIGDCNLDNSYINENNLTSDSYFETLNMTSNSYVNYNNLTNASSIYNNEIENSNISYNQLNNSSTINNNQLLNSGYGFNTLTSYSNITNNDSTSGNANIYYNTLNNSSTINNNILDNNATVSYNAFFNQANLNGVTTTTNNNFYANI